MIQADAKAANVETVTDTPQGKRFVTFHSLRHSFALWLKTKGVPITLAQLMMRHADMKLTTETYGQVDDETLHRTTQDISMTSPSVIPVAQANGNECQRMTTNPAVDLAGSLKKCLNSGDSTTVRDECERVMTSEKMEWKRIELSANPQKYAEKHGKSEQNPIHWPSHWPSHWPTPA
ncbi:tyrosine-type recombinase/integrase [Zavarzinella formosa]|uniref:tyrosine-type recombinase/integrase n=1 Tax=Zavarzinella formosa TaxID=360055 RepID=UPI0002F20D7E|nr:tyrosine-type recombinase/integrase [Zavarzinella formosa]